MTEPEFDKQCNGVVSASSLSRAEVEARIISMVRELALEVGHRLGNISPQSAFGRDLGIESIEEYTSPKSVWVNVDAKLPPYYQR